MRRGAADRGAGRGAVAIRGPGCAALGASLVARRCSSQSGCQRRRMTRPAASTRGRFTAVFFPDDERLARALLAGVARTDSFPWLPRPRQHVLIAIAPDAAAVPCSGPAPGAGVGRGARLSRVAARHHAGAKRELRRGRSAARRCGTSSRTSRCTSGSATGRRDGSTRAMRRSPRASGRATTCSRRTSRSRCAARRRSTSSSTDFDGGPAAAQSAYALSYRAVTELASLDPERGLIAVSSSTGRTDVTSTPRCGRRSASRWPASRRSSRTERDGGTERSRCSPTCRSCSS